jgi:hypothetical protein
MTMYLVAGRVIDAASGRAMPGGQAQLLQRNETEPLATAAIDQRGLFHLGLSDDRLAERLQGRPPDMRLQVSQGEAARPNASERFEWPPPSERTFVKVGMRVPIEEPSAEAIVVDSYRALLSHQEEILKRIRRTPNGGRLFLIEPFRLLADVGVDVTPEARNEIVRIHPGLSGLSVTTYEALKSSRERQPLRYHIRRLDHGKRRDA